jgi:hypothetical protein
MDPINGELLYEMTTMFIKTMMKPFEMHEDNEEEKRMFLSRIMCYCEHYLDKNMEPNTPAAQDGWLSLIDAFGNVHQIPYRGVWTIEQLKEYITAKHNVKPESLNITIMSP